jgi:hypothetical protein
MVLELIGVLFSSLDGFFINHIGFISHVLAAVFLVLTETTMNMRVVTPLLEIMEGMMIGNIPILPNFVTAALFIVWATISIFIYQAIVKWALLKYQAHITLILAAAFVLITIAVNIKYRD